MGLESTIHKVSEFLDSLKLKQLGPEDVGKSFRIEIDCDGVADMPSELDVISMCVSKYLMHDWSYPAVMRKCRVNDGPQYVLTIKYKVETMWSMMPNPVRALYGPLAVADGMVDVNLDN